MIEVVMKPDTPPLGPSNLKELKAYRVVSVRSGFEEASVGDIVLRFPSHTGGVFILNCTRNMMFFDKSSTNRDWDSSFQCLRAFDVRQIVFYQDNEDKPDMPASGQTAFTKQA